MRPLPASVYREQSLGPARGQAVANGLVVFISICAVLYFGSGILMPVALAVLFSVLLGPLVTVLHRVGLPKPVGVVLIVSMAVLAIAALSLIVASTLTTLANDLPRYESSLREKAQNIKEMTSGSGTLERAANVLEDLQAELRGNQSSASSTPPPRTPVPVEIQETGWGPFGSIATVLGMIVHPLTQIGIVILMLTFILFYRDDLRNRLIRLAGPSDLQRTTIALDEAGKRLSRLYAMQILVNSITGAFIGASLFMIGVPGAFLWGILTMVLRFIPYIGTLLAAIFPLVISLAVSEGWNLALMTGAIIVAAELAVGQVIEPFVFGKSTGVSPVAVVLAAAFWTALWGPVGLVLSTPITIMLLVIGRNVEALEFLEILLGSAPVLTPDHAFYQRMLANDPVEAAEQAEFYIQEHRLEDYLSEVAVPGLLLARRDKDRKVLDPEREVAVVSAFSQLLEELWPSSAASNDARAPVALVSAHGALNFAATLAVSALLRLRNISHQLFPQDAIFPGKFPNETARGVKQVCLCYLVAPSSAKYSYLEKRIASQMREARIMGLAWHEESGSRDMINPLHVAAMLPVEKV